MLETGFEKGEQIGPMKKNLVVYRVYNIDVYIGEYSSYVGIILKPLIIRIPIKQPGSLKFNMSPLKI